MVVPLLNALEQKRSSASQKENEDRAKHLSMNVANINFAVLTDFLIRYAPLQLLSERRHTKRLPVGRRILSSCSYMHAVSLLMKQAHNKGTDLKNVIFVDGRSAIPHPLWTIEHDATLISAIAKHGWIDRDKACRKITSDSEIKWGFPFELSVGDIKPERDDEEWKDLRDTAKRASFFLEDSEALLDALKGFNRHLIIESYGLKHIVEDDSGAGAAKWLVDDESLLNATQKTDDNSKPAEAVDLPTRKDLCKRAKLVLQKSLAFAEGGGRVVAAKNPTPTSAPAKDVSEKGYAVLDQGNRFCILLAEMIRGICKGSLTKAGKQVKLLCSMAYEEAVILKDLFTKRKSDDCIKKAEEMSRIVNQIQLARQSMKVSTVPGKNLFRVMIGIEPVQPKIATDPIFPSKAYLEKGSVAAALQKKDIVRKDDGALGEKAMIRALKKAIEKSQDGVPNVFAESDDADDGLQLTMAEAIILLVFCADGLPLSSTNGASGNLSWKDSCSSVALCAREYFNSAQEKVEKLKSNLTRLDTQGFESVQPQVAKKMASEIVAEEWKEALAEEAVRHTVDMAPDMLAKKRCVMVVFAYVVNFVF